MPGEREENVTGNNVFLYSYLIVLYIRYSERGITLITSIRSLYQVNRNISVSKTIGGTDILSVIIAY